MRKRLFDLALALPGMIFISPLIGLIALVVWLDLGLPVIFRHLRPGHRGKPFTLYKFRSMIESRDEKGDLLSDSERLTALGRFLRSFSLDEIPALFNVVRGEMSLVGPRPLLMQYIDRYTTEQARRHDVLPGITGWAQVSGRNVISWKDKFNLDVWYVDNWSIKLDVKILFLTFWKVLQREGISQPGHVTAEEYMGIEDNNRDLEDRS